MMSSGFLPVDVWFVAVRSLRLRQPINLITHHVQAECVSRGVAHVSYHGKRVDITRSDITTANLVASLEGDRYGRCYSLGPNLGFIDELFNLGTIDLVSVLLAVQHFPSDATIGCCKLHNAIGRKLTRKAYELAAALHEHYMDKFASFLLLYGLNAPSDVKPYLLELALNSFFRKPSIDNRDTLHEAIRQNFLTKDSFSSEQRLVSMFGTADDGSAQELVRDLLASMPNALRDALPCDFFLDLQNCGLVTLQIGAVLNLDPPGERRFLRLLGVRSCESYFRRVLDLFFRSPKWLCPLMAHKFVQPPASIDMSRFNAAKARRIIMNTQSRRFLRSVVKHWEFDMVPFWSHAKQYCLYAIENGYYDELSEWFSCHDLHPRLLRLLDTFLDITDGNLSLLDARMDHAVSDHFLPVYLKSMPERLSTIQQFNPMQVSITTLHHLVVVEGIERNWTRVHLQYLFRALPLSQDGQVHGLTFKVFVHFCKHDVVYNFRRVLAEAFDVRLTLDYRLALIDWLQKKSASTTDIFVALNRAVDAFLLPSADVRDPCITKPFWEDSSRLGALLTRRNFWHQDLQGFLQTLLMSSDHALRVRMIKSIHQQPIVLNFLRECVLHPHKILHKVFKL
jgi:hypothetical protein